VIRLPLLLAVLQREFREIIRNRWLLLGIVIPPPLLVLGPLAMGVFMSDEPLPPEFVQLITQQRPEWVAFSARELTAAFAVQQFLPFFLILPAYLPLAIATYSIIGEKQSRSLEAVLATPIRTMELLAGKTIAALVPGVLTGWLTYLLFVAAASVVYGPNLFGVVTDGSWLAGTFALGPAIGLLSTLAGVLVSARVNDPRLAQQVGGVVIIPIVGIALLQATGILLVGALGYLIAAGVLLAIGAVGLRFGTWLFAREAILTRWK
jgi:ABC-2 type transport system permease protein